MREPFTRVLSDIHFGDRASLVRRMDALAPLFAGPDAVVLNGDTLDTRPGPNPTHTAECRSQLAAFLQRAGVPVTLLTGNHDPDISGHHLIPLADKRVLVLHGDILFDDLVPWSRDARTIRRMIAEGVAREGAAGLAALSIAQRVRIWRQVALALPQRHQAEQNPFRYALHFLADTVWPPNRFLQIFRAWRHEPELANAFAARQQPEAGVLLLGHTHRPTIRSASGGRIIVNTGSYTAPFGGFAADVSSTTVTIRRIRRRSGVFQTGETVRVLPLR